MRICQLVHSLNVGGAELLAAAFARAIGGPENAVFACLDEDGDLGDQLRREGFVVADLKRQPGLDLGCVRRLARFLSDQRIHVIHAHQYTPFFYARLAQFFGRRIPIVFTEHGRFFPDFPRKKRMLVNPWLLRRRDRVTAVGRQVREALVNNDNIPRERIEIVYNGVDLERIVDASGERDGARRELGLAPDDVAVLTVARLDPIKDHRSAVDAMKLLQTSHPNIRLLLAGNGPEQANIEERIRENGVESTVRMLGLRRDVPRLLAAADVFLLNSFSEGIPLTIIEAMAAGLPVIATRVGGMPEVILDQETGILVEPSNPAGLAQAIGDLASDPTKRRRYGEAGRIRAFANFSEKAMMDRYREIFAEAVGARIAS